MDTPPPPAREASVHFPDDGLAEALGMDSDPFSKEIMEIQRHLRSISRGKGRLKVAASDVSSQRGGIKRRSTQNSEREGLVTDR